MQELQEKKNHYARPPRNLEDCIRCSNSGVLTAESINDKVQSFGFRCCNWSDYWAESKGEWLKAALPQWDHSNLNWFIPFSDLQKPASRKIIQKRNNPLNDAYLNEPFKTQNWEHPVFLKYIEIYGRDEIGKLYLEWKNKVNNT